VNGPLLVLWLGLCSYRLTRIVTLDTFMEPVRERIYDRWPPDFERSRWRYSPQLQAIVLRAKDRPGPKVHPIGQLVECAWCIGFWLSGAVVLAASLVGSVPLPILTWFAVSTLVGLIGEVDVALTR
jgi:hypothetical protein